jgi:subtilisin
VKTLRMALGIVASILLSGSLVLSLSAQTSASGRRVLIGFNHLVESENPLALSELIRRAGGQVDRSYHLFPIILATLNDATIEQLKSRPDIAYIEEDQLVYAVTQETSWGVDRIDADRVWNAEYGGTSGAGLDVAILDTGIDIDHPDLVVAGGVNCTGNILRDGGTRPSYWDDNEGHGTHCAGVVAARNNDIGVVGVAPEARLWAVKVLADDRSGYISDVIQGIEWCVDNGIEIVSMSFTGGFSQALRDACDSAYEEGLLLVGASGNDGTAVGYPAAYDTVVAVSALDRADGLASFSCVGPEIELIAPGVGIRSTHRDGGYAALSGTSMACPHVAGVAALIWASSELDLGSAAAVRARLRDTAEPLASLTPDQAGYGLVDAEKAVIPPAVIDLAVTRVAVTDTIVQGDAIDIVVTVENFGNRSCPVGVTVTLHCADGDAGADVCIGTRTIHQALMSGASTTLTYTWDTTDVATGSHTIVARHDLADEDAANNSGSASTVVRAPITDVAVVAMEGPSGVTIGDSAQIVVTVQNVGERNVGGDIVVTLASDQATAADRDDVTIGTEVIAGGLSVGENVDLTYTWNTEEVEAGVHTVTGYHDVVDEYADNDSDSIDVTVSAATESADSAVTISSIMPRTMWAGMPGSIMIRGRGFMEGATITFEKGEGPIPVASGVRPLGTSSIIGRVTVEDDPWPIRTVWDVRVTNPDGSSALFREGFIVQP